MKGKRTHSTRCTTDKNSKDAVHDLAGAICEQGVYDYVDSFAFILMNQMRFAGNPNKPNKFMEMVQMYNECLEFLNGQWIEFLSQNENLDHREMISNCNELATRRFYESSEAHRYGFEYLKRVGLQRLNAQLQLQRTRMISVDPAHQMLAERLKYMQKKRKKSQKILRKSQRSENLLRMLSEASRIGGCVTC